MPTPSELIRTARSDAGLSQAALGARAAVSQPAVARYESGVALPTLPTLERLLASCDRQLDLRMKIPRAGTPAPSSIRGQLGSRASLLRRHRSALLEAARGRGVVRVRVFGSIARGEEDVDSDVDLLVDLLPNRTLVDLAGFGRDASELLGVSVDVAMVDMLKPAFRHEVEAEALPL